MSSSLPWLVAFTRIESSRVGIRRRWLVVVAVLAVGVSLALPLFLYLRGLETEPTAPAASRIA
jgi:Terpene cyclase DEP1